MPYPVKLNYCLGPWKKDTSDPEFPYYDSPAGTKGSVDLRSIPEQSTDTGNSSHGFFAVDGPIPPSCTLLGTGDCRDLPLTPLIKSTWKSLTGVDIEGDKLANGLMHHMTEGSDPTGLTGVKPLSMNPQGFVELYLGGHSRIARRKVNFNSNRSEHRKYLAKVEELHQIHFGQYQDLEDAGIIPHGHSRKVLSKLCEDTKTDKSDPAKWKRFLPQRLRQGHEGPAPHATSFSDDFNRSDEDLDVSANWINQSGNNLIRSNQVKHDGTGTTNAASRNTNALSSADHSCEITRVDTMTSSAYVAPSVRHSSSVNLEYYTVFFRSSSPAIFKRVAGVFTSLQAVTSEAAANTYKCEAATDLISAFINDVFDASVTDTSITGNLFCGLSLRQSNNIGDDWSCTDDTGVGVIPYHHLY